MKKHTRSKRIISVICVLLMVITTLPETSQMAKAAKAGYYDIKFEKGVSDGSLVPEDSEVCSGASFTIPTSPVPKRTGYEFVGYYEKSNTLKVYKPGDLLTSSVQRSYTLIPKWTNERTYTIKFSDNGISGIKSLPASGQVPSGKAYTIPVSKPTRQGYSFVGYKEKNKSTIYKAGGTLASSITRDYELVPVWSESFFATNADEPWFQKDATLNTYNVRDYKGKITAGSSAKIKVGGWAIFDRGIKSYSYYVVDSSGKVVKRGSAGDIEAYHRDDLTDIGKYYVATGKLNNGSNATFTKNTGFSGYVKVETLSAGKYTAYVTGTTNDGDTFEILKVGFSIDAPRYSITATCENYTVTTASFTANSTVDIKKTIDSLFADYTKTGYKRVWYDSKTRNPVGNTILMSENRNLYCKFEPYSYKVAFYCGESGTKTITLKTGETCPDSIYPQKQNQVFIGWGKKPTLKESIDAGGLYIPDHVWLFEKDYAKGDAPETYYAIFIDRNKTYNVTYEMNTWDVERYRNAYRYIMNQAELAMKNEEDSNSFIKKLNKGGAFLVSAVVAAATATNPVVATIVIAAGCHIGDIASEGMQETTEADWYKDVKKVFEQLDGEYNTNMTSPDTVSTIKCQWRMIYEGYNSNPTMKDREFKRTFRDID